jgi:hypothetical protein
MCKLNESRVEGEAVSPLKRFMRKTASRRLLLMWNDRKDVFIFKMTCAAKEFDVT